MCQWYILLSGKRSQYFRFSVIFLFIFLNEKCFSDIYIEFKLFIHYLVLLAKKKKREWIGTIFKRHPFQFVSRIVFLFSLVTQHFIIYH